MIAPDDNGRVYEDDDDDDSDDGDNIFFFFIHCVLQADRRCRGEKCTITRSV